MGRISETRSGKRFPSTESLQTEDFWGKDLLEKTFMTPNGQGRFALFDVDVTPHGGEKKCYLFDENYFSRKIRG